MPAIRRLFCCLTLLMIGVVPTAPTCGAQNGLELKDFDLLSNDGNVYFENTCWSDYRRQGRNQSDFQTAEVANQPIQSPESMYQLTEFYVPLGLSHSWKSPEGDDWTIPLGGGVRRLFKMRGKTMGLQFQAFDYVSRKPTDPEWELRCTIEFLFD